MNDKVIISVAPVSAASTNVIPDEVAEAALASAENGAAIVHLHVRELNGQLTEDVQHFQKTIDLIRHQSSMIIQASTGGISELSIEQRCAPLNCPGVEMASLNVGSVNLGGSVYINSPQDVSWCAEQIVSKNITPEFEVFELGMINNIIEMSKNITFRNPMMLNIVLGHQGTTPADIKTLQAMHQFIPEGALWGITHFGRTSFDVISAAIAMGANEVRIGFEDSNILSHNEPAANNAQLVKKVSSIINSMDKEVATPEEVRRMLNIKQ